MGWGQRAYQGGGAGIRADAAGFHGFQSFECGHLGSHVQVRGDLAEGLRRPAAVGPGDDGLGIAMLARRPGPPDEFDALAAIDELFRRQPQAVRTVTADNGPELRAWATIEAARGRRFYFARPYCAWERGTHENTNGLLRQYFPRRASVAHLSQQDCDRIARQLNQRPRKRLGYRTPEECYKG